MPRVKKLSKRDAMMRADGYITAAELSEATGLSTTAVHRGITENRIPGKSVPSSAKYQHHYVELDAFMRMGNFASTPAVRANLDKLVVVVRAAKSGSASLASTPRS